MSMNPPSRERQRATTMRVTAAPTVLLLSLVLASLWPCQTARADRLTLKDGRVLEGRILSEDELTVRIELQYGAIDVDRDEISEIERGPLPPQPADPTPPKPLAPPSERPSGAGQNARELEAEIRAELAEIPLHLEFSRARVEDILTAFSRATDMGVKLEAEARRGLEKRRFRMNYRCTDRPAHMVLDDIALHAALDYILEADRVLVSTTRRIRLLRRERGLGASPRRLTSEHVQKMLETQRVDLTIKDQPLRALVTHIEEKIGIPVVVDSQVNQMTMMNDRGHDELLGEFLRRVLDKLGLHYSVQGGTILITPGQK